MPAPMMNLLGGIAKGFTESDVGSDITKGLLATEQIKSSQETRGLAREAFEHQKKTGAENMALQRQKFVFENLFPAIEKLQKVNLGNIVRGAGEAPGLQDNLNKLQDFIEKYFAGKSSEFPVGAFLDFSMYSDVPASKLMGLEGPTAKENAALLRLKLLDPTFHKNLIQGATDNAFEKAFALRGQFQNEQELELKLGRQGRYIKNFNDNQRAQLGLVPLESMKAAATEALKRKLGAKSVGELEAESIQTIQNPRATPEEKAEAQNTLNLIQKQKIEVSAAQGAAAQETKARMSVNAVFSGLQVFRGLAEKVYSVEGVLGRALRAGQKLSNVFIQQNPDLLVFEGLGEAMLARIARAQGEVGVLTDQDVARAKQLIPNVTDTKEVAFQKLQTLENLLQRFNEGLTVPSGKIGQPKGGQKVLKFDAQGNRIE